MKWGPDEIAVPRKSGRWNPATGKVKGRQSGRPNDVSFKVSLVSTHLPYKTGRRFLRMIHDTGIGTALLVQESDRIGLHVFNGGLQDKAAWSQAFAVRNIRINGGIKQANNTVLNLP